MRSPSSGWAWHLAAALLGLVLRVVRSAVRGLCVSACRVGHFWRGLWRPEGCTARSWRPRRDTQLRKVAEPGQQVAELTRALAGAQHRAPCEGRGADTHRQPAAESLCAPDSDRICTGCWRYLARCDCPGRCKACLHPAHLPGQCDYSAEEHQHGGAGRAARCWCGTDGAGAVSLEPSMARASSETVPALGDRGVVSTTCAHMNTPAGTATQGRRSEVLWRHVATLLGLTLHEAAVAAYSAQEAWGRLRLGLGRLVRALRLLGALAGLLWRVLWQAERCATCGGLLRLFSAAAHCDRCAAASVPTLRLKVAQLGQEVEGLTLELSEAAERVHNALERQVQAERAAEESTLRAASLAVEFEATAEDLERLEAGVAWEQARGGNWRTLFLRALALALHQHALSVRRKDRLRAAQQRLSWYRTELAAEQVRRLEVQREAQAAAERQRQEEEEQRGATPARTAQAEEGCRAAVLKEVLEVFDASRGCVSRNDLENAVRRARAARADVPLRTQAHNECLRERRSRIEAERLLRRRLRAAHREGRSLRQENRRLWKAFGCHPMAPAAIGRAAYFRAGGTRP